MVMTWGCFMTLGLPHSSNGCVYWVVTCWNLPGDDRDSVESLGNTKLGQHIVGSTSFCRCICFPSPKYLDLWWFMWTFTGDVTGISWGYNTYIYISINVSQHMEAMGLPQIIHSNRIIGFSIINHPFGVPPFMETPISHICLEKP